MFQNFSYTSGQLVLNQSQCKKFAFRICIIIKLFFYHTQFCAKQHSLVLFRGLSDITTFLFIGHGIYYGTCRLLKTHPRSEVRLIVMEYNKA